MRKNNKILNETKDILPGLIVSISISLISMGLSKFAPSLGAGTIAIFLGMLVGNLFLGQKVFQKGYKFSETNLLSYSIVLLGGTLSVTKLMELGISTPKTLMVRNEEGLEHAFNSVGGKFPIVLKTITQIILF